MKFQIIHLNASGCDITDGDHARWEADDDTDTGDKLVEYIRAVNIYPGESLTVREL